MEINIGYNRRMIRLTVVRKAKKITQIDMARAMGVSQTTLSFIETGRRLPTRKQLKRIAKILSYDDEPLSLLEEIT